MFMSEIELLTWNEEAKQGFVLNPLGGNYVYKGDGFYVSFNPDTSFDFLGSLRSSAGSETALYDDATWRILNGDWRSDYEVLVPNGLQACIDFYESKRAEHRCDWSTD